MVIIAALGVFQALGASHEISRGLSQLVRWVAPTEIGTATNTIFAGWSSEWWYSILFHDIFHDIPNNWMVNTKLDIHICGPLNGLPFWPTSIFHHNPCFFVGKTAIKPIRSHQRIWFYGWYGNSPEKWVVNSHDIVNYPHKSHEIPMKSSSFLVETYASCTAAAGWARSWALSSHALWKPSSSSSRRVTSWGPHHWKVRGTVFGYL